MPDQSGDSPVCRQYRHAKKHNVLIYMLFTHPSTHSGVWVKRKIHTVGLNGNFGGGLAVFPGYYSCHQSVDVHHILRPQRRDLQSYTCECVDVWVDASAGFAIYLSEDFDARYVLIGC
jgi:hypothetical protein